MSTALSPGGPRSHRRLLIVGGCLVLALAVVITVVGGRFALRRTMDEATARSQTTLRLAVAALSGQMSRYESLPLLLADDDDVRALIDRPDDATLRNENDLYLKVINERLGSSDIYVMREGGETIAASNFDTEVSFVGENFRYRPYYTEAIAGRTGRFFALGTTSLKRGYYFSAPVLRSDGSIGGALVVKVDIDRIEDSWVGGDSEIIVSDPEGIVFMSGRREWLYGGLLPLTADRLARTDASRRYANAKIHPLGLTRSEAASGHPLMVLPTSSGEQEYLEVSEIMPEAGWTVSVLSDTTSIRAQALTMVVAALLVLALATALVAFMLQRRFRLAERLAMQNAARAELESRVEERTADLAALNRQLEREVTDRRATETQLRQTQSDLVQAGKLAALGQMSAALSHEFNQPLAAIRTYAESASMLIARDRIDEASDNITRIASLTDRMSAISRHLRNFAREPNQKLGAVDAQQAIADALEIANARLKLAGIEPVVTVPADPVFIRGGAVRLQQVIVNLITNAADAIEQQDERRLLIKLTRFGNRASIEVEDNGPGVPAAIASRIFDPFYTTKGVGKGLGLGLSISYNIVKDFGGELRLAQAASGGARFTILLDLAEPMREAAE